MRNDSFLLLLIFFRHFCTWNSTAAVLALDPPTHEIGLESLEEDLDAVSEQHALSLERRLQIGYWDTED